MNWLEVFLKLVRAESEEEVLAVLTHHKLLDDHGAWYALGGVDNNLAIVGNQQTDPTGALVEKIINAIDANLMAECFAAKIDPEGDVPPATMAEAVEKFFHVKHGRLGDLGAKQQTALAMAIQLVAVGQKDNPCYLVIDKGEGQTPASFPDTFLSLAKSNKLRIPFVQGKFNAGGTGVLQFCGQENFQLIASRRHPKAPVGKGDNTGGLWGFTLIRRIEPPPSDRRRSSMYVYLAPGGSVPSFSAPGIKVLPGDSRKNEPAEAYKELLEYGTVVKLYNYRWKAKSTATTEARFELEKYLHSPCLPFRITETRAYRANYYSTTVSGIWASIDAGEGSEDSQRVEAGFPGIATLNLDSVGPLHYKIAVFKQEVDTRRVPHGVFFTVNGQVHGSLPADFISRRLEFEYLRGHLLVSVDCTQMRSRVREDFFMASRDRIRQNEVYDEVVFKLEADLKDHPGLKALNAARRAKALEKALGDQEDVVQTFHELLKMDPTLRSLFNPGDRLMTKVGPTEPPEFKGRRFPTYFHIVGNLKAPVVKHCPVNRTCRVEFETDAANDYFDRANSPGEILVKPLPALEYNRLWNGIYATRFRPPTGAKPGDVVTVTVSVTDSDRASLGKPPFESEFKITVEKADYSVSPPRPKPPGPKGPDGGDHEAPRLAVPNIKEIRREQWADYTPPFSSDEALRVMRDGQGGYDYIINLDDAYLLTQLRQTKEADKTLAVYWFKWGLALCAMGMLQHTKRLILSTNGIEADNVSTEQADDILQIINRSMGGVASVIIPIIRNLHRGPVSV